MVQNLHNNLIIAPELADMRRRLKNLDTKDGQVLFVSLYNSWCHNAVATFSLCLLAQAYEHASNLLQTLYLTSKTGLTVVATLRSPFPFLFRWTNSFKSWNLLYSHVPSPYPIPLIQIFDFNSSNLKNIHTSSNASTASSCSSLNPLPSQLFATV